MELHLSLKIFIHPYDYSPIQQTSTTLGILDIFDDLTTPIYSITTLDMCYTVQYKCERCERIYNFLPSDDLYAASNTDSSRHANTTHGIAGVGHGELNIICDDANKPNHRSRNRIVVVATCSTCIADDLCDQITRNFGAIAQNRHILTTEELAAAAEIARAEAAKDEWETPLDFRAWCEENDEIVQDRVGFSHAGALEGDIRDYTAYLEDGPFDPSYIEAWCQEVDEMRAYQQANFDFVPAAARMPLFRAWASLEETSDMLPEGAVSHDPHANALLQHFGFQLRLSLYAQTLSDEDQATFLQILKDLTQSDRLELYGLSREISITEFQSFTTWLNNHDEGPRTRDNAWKQLQELISLYTSEVIIPFATHAQSQAFQNTVDEVRNMAMCHFNFVPEQASELSFRDHVFSRPGSLPMFAPWTMDCFDAALRQYQLYLTGVDEGGIADLRLVEGFLEALEEWAETDLKRFCGMLGDEDEE